MTSTTEPVLEARGLVKMFGRVVGLTAVDLKLFPGEVLAVIGDNGAGKSTLMKCLSGAMVPTAGQLFVDGSKVAFKSTKDARDLGIGRHPARERRTDGGVTEADPVNPAGRLPAGLAISCCRRRARSTGVRASPSWIMSRSRAASATVSAWSSPSGSSNSVEVTCSASGSCQFTDAKSAVPSTDVQPRSAAEYHQRHRPHLSFMGHRGERQRRVLLRATRRSKPGVTRSPVCQRLMPLQGRGGGRDRGSASQCQTSSRGEIGVSAAPSGPRSTR